MGPLLFLVYINDLSYVTDRLSCILFADDTNAFASHKNINELEKLMNEEIPKLVSWLTANRLSLNVSKTHYMMFSPVNHNSAPDVKIKIGSNNIDRVKLCKFLGVVVDERLNWKEHIL